MLDNSKQNFAIIFSSVLFTNGNFIHNVRDCVLPIQNYWFHHSVKSYPLGSSLWLAAYAVKAASAVQMIRKPVAITTKGIQIYDEVPLDRSYVHHGWNECQILFYCCIEWTKLLQTNKCSRGSAWREGVADISIVPLRKDHSRTMKRNDSTRRYVKRFHSRFLSKIIDDNIDVMIILRWMASEDSWLRQRTFFYHVLL